MTTTTETGAQKIYKLTEKLKILLGADKVRKTLLQSSGRKLTKALLILAGLFMKPLHASALPVSIAWQVPLNQTHSYQLEVSGDPGFGTTLFNAAVTGKSLSWDAPAEGVYHWRLMRVGKTGGDQEASTFVSGSFIAVDPALASQRQRPAKISWAAVPGADRYKLYVVDRTGKARTMIAFATFFILPTTDSLVMVEVVPYSGGLKTLRNYHFNPSLKWDGGVDAPAVAAAPATPAVAVAPPPALETTAPPAAVAVEEPKAPVSAPEPAPVATTASEDAVESSDLAEKDGVQPESENAAVPSAAPASVEVPPVAATEAETIEATEVRRRKYQLSLFAFHGQEKLRMQKLEVYFSSLERVTGGGGSLWINPVSGLVVSAAGWYHEHIGSVEQPSFFAEKLKVKQSRYLLEFMVGWNLLHWTKFDNQLLTVSFSAASAQLPFLPLEYDASSGNVPEISKKQLSMPGVAAGYSWQSDKLGISLDAGFMKENTDDVEMGWQRAAFDYYYLERLAVTVGFYNRFIQSVRCHSSSVTCLKEGKVSTSAEERGVYIGAGGAFF